MSLEGNLLVQGRLVNLKHHHPSFEGVVVVLSFILYTLPFLAGGHYTEKMDNPNHFELPKELLNGLDECTRGYFLVTINDNGEFEMYNNINDQVDALAITRFLDEYLMIQNENIMDDYIEQKMKQHPEDGKSDVK